MKTLKIVIILFLFAFCLSGFAGQKERTLKNPFFVFNNGLNKQGLPFIPFEEQVSMLKKYGFDGIEHRETSQILELKDALDKQGLNIYADYVKIDIDQKVPYLQEWKQVIPKLKGTGIILWCHLHSTKFKPSDEVADALIVPIMQELADFAKPYGVKVAVYPHARLLAETANDSYRLACKVNRENVGSVFNLCHFLKTGSIENLYEVLKLTLPKLIAVSINGADTGNTIDMEWSRVIQPLGEGTFDVYRVIEFLADNGYQGPIGLQCYDLKTPPEYYMGKGGETWKAFKERYSKPLNTLTREEKENGWKLLFDGKTTKNWRGINQKAFPSTGWKIESGDLIADVEGGAESGNGGDVITQKKYGKFILKWEWQMLSKGGNSGVKYFVQEGIGDNKGYGFGLEYQLLDDKNHAWMLSGKMKPNDYHTLGSLYELYPASADKHPSPLGLWNESMIVCNGNQVEHWLNGVMILEYDRSSADFKTKIAASKFKDVNGFGTLTEGHILLQDHGSIIHYRNIKIREL
jgi:sugar phosphate isomerase/epimerase